MGRPPKPTRLKLLEGNRGKRKLDVDAEPRPRLDVPVCPEHLGGEARAEWERIAPELERLGLLTGVDVVALAGYCANWATVIEAERILGEEGVVIDGRQGLRMNPAQTIRNQAYTALHRFIVEFGLSPASRSRIKVEPVKMPSLEESLR